MTKALGDGMVAFVDRGTPVYVRRADALAWFAACAGKLNGEDPMFDGLTYDSVLWMQAAFGDATYDGRPVGPLSADGVIGPQTAGALRAFFVDA